VKEDRRKRLVSVLESADSWVSATVLAKMLGVSERTIRNYVSELSDEQGIISSKLGYRIKASSGAVAPCANRQDSASVTQEDDMTARTSMVLSRLINAKTPTSLFELSDELGISESTFTNTVLPAVRSELSAFDIKLVNHDWHLSLRGSERDLRRLLGHVATQNVYGYFTSTKTLAKMFPDFDTDEILSELVGICQSSELLLSNYSLNNLLVHILVIIIRLDSENVLDAADDLIDVNGLLERVQQRDEILRCANKIASLFETKFHCTIPERDFRQIILLIALSTDRGDYATLSTANAAQLIDQEFLDSVHKVARETTDHYGLSPFSDDFLLQLTLHSFNAYQRAVFHVGCPNPIGEQIKQSYAPIYDMAVYYTHRLQSLYDVEFSEDEIAFIAFHIGAYIEKNAESGDAISCVVVVERYHDFSRTFAQALETSFVSELSITDVMSYDDYVSDPKPCDLLVTTIDLPVIHPYKVLVAPLLGKHDIRRIRSAVEGINEDREVDRARAFLRGLLSDRLFSRNVELASSSEYIDYLGSLCQDAGCIGSDFIQDVKLRERVSSTAFTDCLAVPHSINQYAERSFACVLHNDKPIHWGRGAVNIVMLIGLTREDMHHFTEAFDIIIDRFTTMRTTAIIMRSDTFEEFASALVDGR